MSIKKDDLSDMVLQLVRMYQKRNADNQALEQQLADCAKMNDQLADELAKQESDFRERIEYLEQGNRDWGALFLAEEELRAAETRQHVCIARLAQSGHARICPDDSVG